MAYDPDLKLLYRCRKWFTLEPFTPKPGGWDNLFLSCISAIHIETGKMAWYYQTTPGNSWDFTATQPLILADLRIKGKKRKVIMQAPKNGFFFILDRKTGEFISAEAFTYVNWANGYDPETGRPIENDFSRYSDVRVELFPGPAGAHSWQPICDLFIQ
ncbi:hypothetical protein ACFLSA_04455 [Bacteroidota bacterium]